jgi:DNA-binding winged helix-turn-helix (wHTH) protein
MCAAFPEDRYPNERAADSHIKRLRKKFSLIGADGGVIETVYGMGYRISAEVRSDFEDNPGFGIVDNGDREGRR